MRVMLIERHTGYRMYEVHEHFGKKWWTARHDVARGDWYVVNSRGTVVQDFGDLWLRIVAACEKFASNTVDV